MARIRSAVRSSPPAARLRRLRGASLPAARLPRLRGASLPLLALLLVTTPTGAQTRADYDRALSLRDRYQYLTVNVPDPATWVGKSGRFSYRKSVKGGHEFVVVDAATMAKQPAFDHERLARALSKETGEKREALRLPFNSLTFSDDERSIEMTIEQVRYRCRLSDYTCSKTDRPLRAGVLRGVNGPVRDSDTAPESRPKPSPDGKWEALVDNFNLAVRAADGKDKLTLLSTDGSEGNYYELSSIAWSPDSK